MLNTMDMSYLAKSDVNILGTSAAVALYIGTIQQYPLISSLRTSTYIFQTSLLPRDILSKFMIRLGAEPCRAVASGLESFSLFCSGVMERVLLQNLFCFPAWPPAEMSTKFSRGHDYTSVRRRCCESSNAHFHR